MVNNRLVLYFSLITLIGFFFEPQSEARFATHKDAASEIQFFNRTIDVKENGSYEEVIELKVKILNDSGRTNIATEPLYYDETTEKLKVIHANTSDQGIEYSVAREFVEDKQIASQSNGFSSYHQVLISFPHIHVGSELYLKYSLSHSDPSIPRTFFTNFVYGRVGYWIASKVKLTSEIPFLLKVNDPEKYLEVQSRNEGKKQILEIVLKNPVIKQVIEEQEALLSLKAYPWVSVSTLGEWKSLIEKVTPDYEKVLSRSLPELFQTISNRAKSEKDLFGKLNRITSLLAEELHYMGDWRTISGRIFPNELSKIASERRGDCKDFATATTAILRNLGINAQPAWVKRGGYYDDPVELPSANSFDHVIVRVEADNKVYWIDPTNFVSFAQGLFPDIANRWALPLSSKGTHRERIPQGDLEKSQVVTLEELSFSSKGQTRVKGLFSETGSVAIGITGASLMLSKENIDYVLISSLDDVNRMSRWNIKPYDLKSRVVQDVKFEYEYEKTNAEMKTSDGMAHVIRNLPVVQRYLIRTQQRVSDLLILDQPTVLKRVGLLKGVTLKGKANLNCKLGYPWVSASRQVIQKKTGLEVSDVFVVKQTLIENAVLLSQEYNAFQRDLSACFDNVAIVLSL